MAAHTAKRLGLTFTAAPSPARRGTFSDRGSIADDGDYWAMLTPTPCAASEFSRQALLVQNLRSACVISKLFRYCACARPALIRARFRGARQTRRIERDLGPALPAHSRISL